MADVLGDFKARKPEGVSKLAGNKDPPDGEKAKWAHLVDKGRIKRRSLFVASEIASVLVLISPVKF